jgi:hypothetical protein
LQRRGLVAPAATPARPVRQRRTFVCGRFPSTPLWDSHLAPYRAFHKPLASRKGELHPHRYCVMYHQPSRMDVSMVPRGGEQDRVKCRCLHKWVEPAKRKNPWADLEPKSVSLYCLPKTFPGILAETVRESDDACPPAAKTGDGMLMVTQG